jgi:Lhr-like helicase
MDSAKESCQACGATDTSLMKFSLGKDFFGRPYDRLSPSTDQHPKWYCPLCSMHKNLQRDFRDIRAEFDKLHVGQVSTLSASDEFQRASLRLQEIQTILHSGQERSPLLTNDDVTLLIERFRTVTMPA